MTPTRTTVLTYREARDELARTLERFRAGDNADIVVFGAHRKAEAAIVPIALVDLLLARLDDEEIAQIVRERRNEKPEPLAEVAARLGLDFDAL